MRTRAIPALALLLIALVAGPLAIAVEPAAAGSPYWILRVTTSPARLQPGAPGTITFETASDIDPTDDFVLATTGGTVLATATSVVLESPRRASVTVAVPADLRGVYSLLAQDESGISASASVRVGVAGGTYHPVPPVRALDTRIATGWPSALPSGTAATVRVTGIGAVPASGVTAVVGTLTAVTSTGEGYLSAYPSGAARPTVSNCNFTPGTVVPNQVVLPVSAAGTVDVYNFGGRTDVLLDIAGWFGDDTSTLGATYARNNGGAVRVVDTRAATRLAARSTTRFVVPATNSVGLRARVAIESNITVTRAEAGGYLTVFAAGAARPNTSVNNFVAGRNSASAAIVEVDGSQAIEVYNGSDGAIDLVIDVTGGFYTDSPVPYRFEPATPFRLADSRQPPLARRLAGKEVVGIVAPPGAVPANASVLVGNITAAEPLGAGYLNVVPGSFASGALLAASSVLNFEPGQTVANAFSSGLSADDSLSVYNSDSPTHVLIDVFGWYTLG